MAKTHPLMEHSDEARFANAGVGQPSLSHSTPPATVLNMKQLHLVWHVDKIKSTCKC